MPLHTLHIPAHVIAHHGASAHALAAHTQLFQHALEVLSLAQALLILHHSPHSMSICNTLSNCHQPTHTSPCILPVPTSPMPCTAYDHYSSPTLPCTQATKPKHKATISQATNAMHHHIGSAPPAAAQHHRTHLCPPWPSSAMALGHHVEQGASTYCPS